MSALAGVLLLAIAPSTAHAHAAAPEQSKQTLSEDATNGGEHSRHGGDSTTCHHVPAPCHGPGLIAKSDFDMSANGATSGVGVAPDRTYGAKSPPPDLPPPKS